MAFVNYLIDEKDSKGSRLHKSIDINQGDLRNNESPVFYALSKIKSQADKIKMAKALLKHPDLDLEKANKDHRTCYEAYHDISGFDEAANLLEKHSHLRELDIKETNIQPRAFS